MMDQNLYYYKGFVRSVYDGDTIRVDIDLGLSVGIKNEPVRLNRINAPEVRGRERELGLKSRDYLRERIDNKEIILQTEKDDKGKYGRYIVEIWLKEQADYINI
ncbi:MAG: thermonuclease family protein, partial [Nitrospiria bacterium]